MRLRSLLAALLALGLAASAGRVGAAQVDPRNWPMLLDAAKGQSLNWYAWGGETKINDYIAWVGGEMRQRHGIRLNHVKLADTSEAVSRLLAERTAGRTTGGAVDLVWINGENFASLKAAGLLFGPFATDLPNFALVDVDMKPVLVTDFTLPVEGYEAPWGTAQLTFYHDSARLAEPPRSLSALLDWARANPGRFTYPQPPDFLGTTFLKQVLVTLAPDKAALAGSPDDAAFAAASRPVFDYLDKLHPFLWRKARTFPQNVSALRTAFADGELDVGLTFNPGDAATGVARGEFPMTVRTYGLEDGTIGNAHFVAIPLNASSKAAALVVADFLLSPLAQARKADQTVWGDPTVLALSKLGAADRALFESPLGGINAGPGVPALPEPHPAWSGRLEADWARRYGVAP